MLSRDDELRNRRLCAMTKDPKDLHRNRSWWFVHDQLTRLYVWPTQRSNSDWAKLTFLYLFLSRDGVRVCWANISNYWWIKRKKKADCGGCTSGFSPMLADFFPLLCGPQRERRKKSSLKVILTSKADVIVGKLTIVSRILIYRPDVSNYLSLNVRSDVSAISHVCVDVCEWIYFRLFLSG